MTAEIPKATPHLADSPPERGARWIVLSWLAVIVGLAVLMAASFEQQGAGRAISVAYGAAGATSIVVVALIFYGAVRRATWKRTRGHPFRIGDTVMVTSGPFHGKQGRIVKYWQGDMDFNVTLESAAGNKSIWFRVTELRKLDH